jgi:serine/threonine protein kinase/streptogramin lyase
MSTSLESGGVVGGYRIESLLGRGGMAAVYLAEDGRLKRKVALKVLSPELAADDAFRRRFVDESERLASVDHPNIIPVYEAGQDGDHLFIAMRYVDSTDLKELIASEGHLAPERAIAIVTQVAGALDAAHAKGLVHRDVKPANVLVAAGSGADGSDHAYLSDFGLTKRTQETSGLTKTGFFMGTIDYVAPEQIGATGVDGRTDQYALACVLFQCLTGRTPYPREDDAAILYSHLSEPPPSVTEAVPGLPPMIDAVLAGGMAKEKDDRYGSCLEFARAARSALFGPSGETTVEPSATASPGVPSGPTSTVIAAPALVEEPPPKRRSRRNAVIFGAVILALGLVAGGLALLSGGDDADRTTLVALDANDGSTVSTLHDEAFSEHLWGILSIEEGDLWQATEDSLVRRDDRSGEILDTLPIRGTWRSMTGGFGYVWIAHPSAPGETEIERMSPLSGNSKTIRVDGDTADLQAGNGSIWFLAEDGTLSEIDPVSMKVADTYDTGTLTPGTAVPLAGFVWICECEVGRVAQFDPRRGEIVKELDLPEHGFVIGVDTTDPRNERVWLLDPEANTLTPIDPATGEVGRAVGVGGAAITDAKVVGDSLWVASQTEVTRIELPSLNQHVFPVPEGVSAGSLAPAPDGSIVWVANCGCPIQN